MVTVTPADTVMVTGTDIVTAATDTFAVTEHPVVEPEKVAVSRLPGALPVDQFPAVLHKPSPVELIHTGFAA